MKIVKTNLKFGSLSKRSKTVRAILHHAEASTCDAATIHQWHKNNGWSGIGYHFVVRKNGTIERGRPENTIGAHAQGSNSDSIGICFEGSYMKETMPSTQIKAGQELLAYLKKKYGFTKVQRHKDVCSTSCPGTRFPFAEIVSGATSANVASSEPAKTTSSNGDITVDGIWGGDTTRKAQKVFGTVVDGVISGQLSCYKKIVPGIISCKWTSKKGNGSPLVKAMQKWMGEEADGFIGPKFVKGLQRKLGTVVDGRLDNPSLCIKAFQKWLNMQ